MPSAVQQQIADYLRTQGQDPNAGNISRAIAAASINPGLIPGLSVGGTGEYSPGDPRTGGLRPGNAPIAPPVQSTRRSVSAPTYNRPPPPGASVPGPGSIGALSELIASNQPPGGSPSGSTTPPGDNRNEPQPQQASRGAQAASSRPPPTLQPAQPDPLVDRLGRRRQFAYNPPVPTAAEDALQGQRVAPLGSVAPDAGGDPDQLMTAMDKAMMAAANQGTSPTEEALRGQRIAPGGSLPTEDVLAQQRSGVAPGEVVDTLAPPNPRPGMTLTRGDASPPSGMLPLQGEPQPGDQAGRTRQRESPAYNPDRGGGPNAMIQPPPPSPPIHMLNAQDPATLAALIAGLGVGGAGLSAILASGGDGSGTPRPTAQNRGARRAAAPSVAQQIVTGVGPTLPNTNMATQGASLLNSGAQTFTQQQTQAPRAQPAQQPTPTPQPQPQPQPTPTPQPATKTPGATKAPTPQAERAFNEPNLFDKALGRVSMPTPVAVDIPTPTKEAPTVERTAMTAAPRTGPVVPTGTRVPIPVGNLDDPNNVAVMQARQSILQSLLRRAPVGGKIIPTTRGTGPYGAALAIGPYGGAADLATEAALYGRGMGRQMRQ